MTDETRRRQDSQPADAELSAEELADEAAAELPDREAMSLLFPNPSPDGHAPLVWEQAVDRPDPGYTLPVEPPEEL